MAQVMAGVMAGAMAHPTGARDGHSTPLHYHYRATAVCGVSGYDSIHRYCRNATTARSEWMEKR